jgi:ribonucleoside-diphosphate reductase alpha chain
MLTSIELAEKRGPFPAIHGSIYDPENITWQPPTSIVEYHNDYGRPDVDWDAILEKIKKHGIRNAAQTTVAPTGTISTVAGCEGYGCEPVFALAYIRHVNDNGKDLKLTYASPAFEKTLIRLGMDEKKRQEIFEKVMQEGSCQNIEEIPTFIRNAFVVSSDITAEEHVRMQAALQAFVDNSLSKTINFPHNATEEDVATAYQLAWELGCKGITVYVTGSRETVVLETHATAKEKGKEKESVAVTSSEQSILWSESKKPRPRYLTGFTYQIGTPLGKAFVTINENGDYQPFEVFINSAKAGSDTAAVSEAIGRLISYILRLTSTVEPSKRMRDVISQLNGIGGGRPMGFGPNRVRSLPDGLAQILTDYIQSRDERLSGMPQSEKPKNGDKPWVEVPATQRMMQIGDLCPECGQAAFVNEEGCRKCYACGYSEC